MLIPVDFSSKQDIALKVGFELARRLDLSATLLHASVIPMPSLFPQFPDDYNGIDNTDNEIEEMEVASVINHEDEDKMKHLKDDIQKKIENNVLPQIQFETVVAEGMPEEVIADYCIEEKPELIVMVTRSRAKREEELVGSVTAEVIDNVRVPLFSLPEDYQYLEIKDIVNVCVICHLDGNDFMSVSELMKMFENPVLDVWLFPVADKLKLEERNLKLTELSKQLAETYSESKFHTVYPDENNLREEIVKAFGENHIQMILAPNKKRNIFARLFRPGLAHRILFEKDIPMFVMPV